MTLDAAVIVCPLLFLIRSTGSLVVGGHRVDLVDSLALRHYHGDAALGALLNEADHRVRHVEAEVIAGGHRRHDEAVLQRDVAKPDLFKQFCISAIHRGLSFLSHVLEAGRTGVDALRLKLLCIEGKVEDGLIGKPLLSAWT